MVASNAGLGVASLAPCHAQLMILKACELAVQIIMHLILNKHRRRMADDWYPFNYYQSLVHFSEHLIGRLSHAMQGWACPA